MIEPQSKLQWATLILMLLSLSSGLARSLRTSAFSPVTRTRSAFRPTQKNLAPALSARFASTDAREGKIHQVIGAVVDGTIDPIHERDFHA